MKLFTSLLFAFIVFTVSATAQVSDPAITIADSLFTARNYGDAINKYSELILRYDKSTKLNIGRFHWRRGAAYAVLNNNDKAFNDYATAIPYYKGDAKRLSSLLADRGRLYKKQNNYKAALNDFDMALEANSENAGVYLDRGWAYYLNQEYQRSVDDYTKGIVAGNLNERQMAVAFTSRGLGKEKLKQYTDAINDYNEALNRNPNLGYTYMVRADALQNHGDYQLSIEDYTKALDLYKEDTKTQARIYDNRAFNYRQLFKFKEALDDIARALPLAVNPGILYWNRASIYAESGHSQLAIDAFNQTLGFYKDNKSVLSSLHYSIASECYVLKNYAKTIEECKEALAADSTYHSVYFLLGKVYYKHLAKSQLGVQNFNKVIQLDTAKTSTSYIFSQFYLGNKTLAMSLLQKEVLKGVVETEAIISYYNIACMFSIMNETEKATIYLKKVVDAGYPKQFIANDEDLDNIRSAPEYISMMAAAKK